MPQALEGALATGKCSLASERLIVTATACVSTDDMVPSALADELPGGLCQGLQLLPATAHAQTSVPSLEAFAPGSDVLLRAIPTSSQVAAPLLSQQHQTVPFNDPQQAVDFETPYFKGKLLALFKGLPNTPVEAFKGRKRLMWITVQGQFKQPMPFDSLMIGSEFSRPLRLPASALIVRATQWRIHKMGTGVQLNPIGEHPHILAPLIASAQTVNVSMPGQQRDLLAAEEDVTLYDNNLVNARTGKPMAAGKRQSFFSSKGNRQGRMFDTEHVWTFQLFDQNVDYSTFTLPIPLFKLDLAQVLDGQPMQLTLKDTSNNATVMCFEIWHKRMLEHKSNNVNSSSSDTADTALPAAAATVNGQAEDLDSAYGCLAASEGSSISRASSYSSCCSNYEGEW